MNILWDSPTLFIASMPVGPFAMNQHIIADPRSGNAALVDAGGAPEPFEACLDERGFTLSMLLQTHGHIDHVATLRQTWAKYPDLHCYMHPLDMMNVERAESYGQMIGFPIEAPPRPDRELAEGDVIELGELRWNVLHTPGHAPGHVCFYEEGEGALIGGDLLFKQSIGRTDLPGCDPREMVRSLRRIMTLPDQVRVFPGHMGDTTIGEERRANPFVRGI